MSTLKLSRPLHGTNNSKLVTTIAHPRPNTVLYFDGRPTNRFPSVWKALGLTGVGLGVSAILSPTIFCEPVSPLKPEATSPPPPGVYNSTPSPPPESSVNLYELSFGTVAGICAGVFVKKGAKAIAFFLGGVFVLLQYLGTTSVIRVDWGRVSKRFENLFYTKDLNGASKPPTVYSFFNWLVNFLAADFQPRASFVAGLLLGLRIG
ncbi:fun14 family protein [Moniliophthora roreri MCA 2997]|uniref:Fun14 family protein n=1 Tax=Moniliophthora roreri (strain MCA 2997) TaxID=1381753 RepID=V2XWB5_MONRO|nr:fun14 family protein [Moniliophthora roreri MCA 2997]